MSKINGLQGGSQARAVETARKRSEKGGGEDAAKFAKLMANGPKKGTETKKNAEPSKSADSSKSGKSNKSAEFSSSTKPNNGAVPNKGAEPNKAADHGLHQTPITLGRGPNVGRGPVGGPGPNVVLGPNVIRGPSVGRLPGPAQTPRGGTVAADVANLKTVGERLNTPEQVNQMMTTFRHSGPTAQQASRALRESLQDSPTLRGAVKVYRDRSSKVVQITTTGRPGTFGSANLNGGPVYLASDLRGNDLKAVQNHELGHAILNLEDGPPGGEGPNQVFESAVHRETGAPAPTKRDRDGNGIIEYFNTSNGESLA